MTSGDRPLVSLLAAARDAFAADFDERMKRSEFFNLSMAHATNVLRHLEGPQQASRIVSVCGVSKQAVSQQISHLERNGYLTVSPHPTDHRVRVLHPTDRGRRAKAFAEQTLAEIETEWVASLGPADGPQVRRILMALAGRLDR